MIHIYISDFKNQEHAGRRTWFKNLLETITIAVMMEQLDKIELKGEMRQSAASFLNK